MTNTPKLRFDGFLDEWKAKDLKQVLKVNSGKDYKHLGKGDIPVYGTGGYMTSVDSSLSEEDAVGIGRKGSIDKPQKLKAPFWTVDTLFYCTPIENNDLEFIYALFKNINWKKHDESTGVPSLSKNTIEKIIKFIPSPLEQIKIGDFFNKMDSKIQLQEDKIDLLKEQKKGFMQKIFSQELRFKNEDEKELPKWELKALGDVIKVNTGRDYKHLNSGNIPVYGTGGYMLCVDESLSEEDAIGIGRKGTINQPQKLIAPFWTVDTLFYCTSKNCNDLDFIYTLFQFINWEKYDESTGVPSLSKKTIDAIEYAIPCYEEQKKIGAFFKKFDERIFLESEKLTEIQIQKQAFMQQMFI